MDNQNVRFLVILIVCFTILGVLAIKINKDEKARQQRIERSAKLLRQYAEKKQSAKKRKESSRIRKQICN